MSAADWFFDTNVLLYLLSDEVGKATRVEELVASGGTISVQVLNETARITTRKFGMSWTEAIDFLLVIRKCCRTIPLTVQSHDEALQIAARYGYDIYDSLIWASAIKAGCSTLFSEDMQHGQVIGTTRLINPFRD